MEIKIKGDDKELLMLSDDNLDNDNFVNLYFTSSKIGGEEVCVSLDELLSAVYAFEKKRIMSITRENKNK